MSQGLSVQAQAALAQRLQAGGVNGLNGGVTCWQLAIIFDRHQWSIRNNSRKATARIASMQVDCVSSLCRVGFDTRATALQGSVTRDAAGFEPAW